MKVSIKDLSVFMEIKNRGIELEVRDTHGYHLGDLILNKAGLIWCPGRTTRKNGIKRSWAQFIVWMKEEEK